MQKLTVFSQRLKTKKADRTGDPEDFLRDYERMLEIRRVIKELEAQLSKYVKSFKKFETTAVKLSAALGTAAKTTAHVAHRLEQEASAKAILDVTIEKRAMLDDLVKQRKRLEELGIGKDYQHKRLEDMKAKHAKDALKPDGASLAAKNSAAEEKQLAKLRKADGDYQELLGELSKAVKYVVNESNGPLGPWGIVGKELTSFREIQAKGFELMMGLFVGPDPSTVPDPSTYSLPRSQAHHSRSSFNSPGSQKSQTSPSKRDYDVTTDNGDDEMTKSMESQKLNTSTAHETLNSAENVTDETDGMDQASQSSVDVERPPPPPPPGNVEGSSDLSDDGDEDVANVDEYEM